MIALKYSLFALIATGFNLLFQYLSLLVYADWGSLYLAMFLGTLVGLVCKYILDKKFIFYHTPKSKTHDLKKFIAYTVTGIFTTVIFWGTEIEFNIYFKEAPQYCAILSRFVTISDTMPCEFRKHFLIAIFICSSSLYSCD